MNPNVQTDVLASHCQQTSARVPMVKRGSVVIRLLLAALLVLGLAMSNNSGQATHAQAATDSAAVNLTPAQIEAAVEEYFASVAAFDIPRYVNNFAPDGVLEDPVGTPPQQGRQAIAAYIAPLLAPFSEVKTKVQEVIVCGQEAAVNWKIRATTTTGKKIVIDGMGVFKFNQAGKLESVREFWDLAALLAQL